MRSIIVLLAGICCLAFFSCNQSSSETLPVYGKFPVQTADGMDTIIRTIPHFSFTNQEGKTITHETIDQKIYVTDFFFTSCPTICPVMTKQMLRVYERYKENEQILLISHTIDPKRDSVETLRNYAAKIGILDDKKWHFVTGDKEALYDMAYHYMVLAEENEHVPGGFEHSGAFLLVDSKKQIRGIYDGTNEEEVSQLMNDIQILLYELL